jgi:deazaflavin-dependent oxidoreductase (nitroreductase family)
MATPRRIPDFLWHFMRWLNPRISRRFREGRKAGPSVLVLTTTGRKSGSPHSTPLQYELVEGVYYVASARGAMADWYRNLVIDPQVNIEVRGEQLAMRAEAITDPVRIADFFEMRLERNPKMIGAMMRIEGLPAKFSRTELEEFASHKALAALHRI